MTYEELLAIVNAGNAYAPQIQNPNADGLMNSGPAYYTQPTNTFLADPNNPLGMSATRGADGMLYGWQPRDAQTGAGGADFAVYDQSGDLVNSGYREDTGPSWRQSLLGAAGTLGGAALLGNAGALFGGAGGAAAPAAAAGGAAPAAAGGVGTGAAATAAGGAMLPMVDDWAAPGSFLSTNPASIGGAAAPSWASLLGNAGSSLLSNPGLLAAGLGAVAGIAGNDDLTNTSSTSQSGTTSSNATQGLAPWMQPYAQSLVARGNALSNMAPTNDALQSGTGLLGGLALQGDPLVNAARGQQSNVIGGGMLNSNPYIDQVARNIGDRMGEAYATGTRANIGTRFNNDGNSVGAKSAYQQSLYNSDRAFSDSLGSTLSNLYYGNYSQERAAQDAASRGSLGFGQFQSGNAQNLYNAGAQDWNRNWSQLSNMQGLLSPAFGSQSSGTNTSNQTGATNQTIQAPNNWMAGLGGAATGAGMYRSIFG